jgi:hypothetical protein
MMGRCFARSKTDARCTRAEHPDDVHVWGAPVTIPPMWWEAAETTAFLESLRTLIRHNVIAVDQAALERLREQWLREQI